jgi:MFS family permease
MKDKQGLIAEIQEGLTAGVISEADLRAFIHEPPAPSDAAVVAEKPDLKADKLSAVDVMFYIAGIVLFSAIVSFIAQSWEDGSSIVHILLSAGVGTSLWALAYHLIKSPEQTDIRKGLINSLLLTGSLSIITGGYIITNEIIGGYGDVNFLPGAFMLALVGAAHLGFDRLIKRELTLLMGVLLCVASFPALLFEFVKDVDPQLDVWSAIFTLSAGLLVYAARVVAKLNPDRPKIHSSFDSFAAFLALGCMYAASFGGYGLLWLALLIGGVFGIFYLSIISQNKHLLGSASFFLVLTVITIAFKYFSGFGVTTSLIMATLGLLGSAAVAASINKKYFKPPTPTQ